MAGQWIDIAAADGGTFKGYLTVPASGSGPGILLLQEIFGVNSSMREVADYYAEEGYVVLAPDLFWRLEPGIELGYSEADFNKAFDYYQRFDADQSIKDVRYQSTALGWARHMGRDEVVAVLTELSL